MKLEDLPAPKEGVSHYGDPELTCMVEGCRESRSYGNGYEDPAKRLESFTRYHLTQHIPPNIPSVSYLTVRYSGTCTNCGSRFECEPEDIEYIWCDNCDASWTLEGDVGRTDREIEEW